MVTKYFSCRPPQKGRALFSPGGRNSPERNLHIKSCPTKFCPDTQTSDFAICCTWEAPFVPLPILGHPPLTISPLWWQRPFGKWCCRLRCCTLPPQRSHTLVSSTRCSWLESSRNQTKSAVQAPTLIQAMNMDINKQ